MKIGRENVKWAATLAAATRGAQSIASVAAQGTSTPVAAQGTSTQVAAHGTSTSVATHGTQATLSG